MKLKLNRKTRKAELTEIPACPCPDPVVFGHAPPCPRWETRANPARPAPGPQYRSLLRDFSDVSARSIRSMQSANETAQAVERLRRTTERLHELMREIRETGVLQEISDAVIRREINEAAASASSSPPTGPPGGPG